MNEWSIGNTAFCVVGGGLYGGRFADHKGEFHTDVMGHLDNMYDRHLFRDVTEATAVADHLRDKNRYASEVWEVCLIGDYGGRPPGTPGIIHTWTYKQIRVVHRSRMPVPPPESQPKTGEDVWKWLHCVANAQNVLRGSVIPGVDVTVAEVESLCGKGMFAKLVKWSDKQKGFSVSAAAILPIEEVYADPKAIADWKARYGDFCHHTRKEGEAVLPTDKVYVHYIQIG